MILAERTAQLKAEAKRSSGAALIAHLKLQIEKLWRKLHGMGWEVAARLIDHMERELEELEAAAVEAAIACLAGNVSPPRHPPSRKPFWPISRAS